MITNILLIVSVFITLLFDIKYHKIFNTFIYPVIILGILFNIISIGYISLLYSILGFLVGICLCYIPFKLKASSLGEFKLLGLIGAVKGYEFVVIVSIISYFIIILLFLFSLIFLYKNLNLKTSLSLIFKYDVSILTIIEDNIYHPLVPYSAVIFICIILVLIMPI